MSDDETAPEGVWQQITLREDLDAVRVKVKLSCGHGHIARRDVPQQNGRCYDNSWVNLFCYHCNHVDSTPVIDEQDLFGYNATW